ncbi:MAG: DNA polymerase IV [Candidatus Omnitrophica bacterium]|nr:DNA polymerase IV [Candidatus Omnitrophota bacterium]
MSENTNNILSLSSFPRPIIHIDCDAFFTSVEQALHPELKGKPVVTGKERGIVACASYEAKALGVKRPMRLWEAKKLLPQLICLPSDYETYSLYSKRMFSIIREFTPDVEEYSIDEAFADLSGLRRIYRTGYPEIAFKIKQKIEAELGLTVSVGLSASKILAKIGSKHQKPNGFTVIRASELHQFLPQVALDRVCGFGPNTVALLMKKGVRNVWDYVSRPELWAKQLLGKIGVELWHELRGDSVYPIVMQEKTDYDSISKTKTFTPPSSDKDFVRAQLIRNMESAFIKLRRYRLRAKWICIFLRNQEFKSWGTEAQLDRSTSSIFEAAPLVNQLFAQVFRDNVAYRLTGIVLSKIEPDQATQYSLFDDIPRIQSLRSIDRVIDEVNELYGKHKLHLGTSLWLGQHKQHISARGDLPERKMDLMKGETVRQRLGIPVWDVKV